MNPINHTVLDAAQTLPEQSHRPVLNHQIDETTYNYLDYKDVTNFKRFTSRR